MAAPDPPRLDLRSTTQILRHSLSTLRSALPPLLLASLLLFSFRSALLAGTLHLTAAVDRDPAVRSLLSRLSPSQSSSSPSHPAVRSRGPPFLHLTRVGTLDDDDFFSDSTSTSSSSFRPSSNSTFPHPIPLFLSDGGALGLGFPKSHQIRVRVSDNLASPILFSLPRDDEEEGGDRERIFDRGLDLGRQDAFIILYLLSLLSSTHALAILGFLLSYTFSLGTVFFAVASSYLGRPIFLTQTLNSGARFGIRRLTGFVFLWWAARDAVVQFLCMWFLSEIRDQNKLLKLFIKVKLMPFSFTAPSPFTPWLGIHDEDLPGFLLMWSLLEAAFSFIFTAVPWLMIMDHNVRRRGPDLVKEGCHLVSLMASQALWIKILEMLVCGNLGRRMLMVIGGRLFAGFFQSVAEVYFMVVWLIFYFAARCKDEELVGRRFGPGDLEDCINALR